MGLSNAASKMAKGIRSSNNEGKGYQRDGLGYNLGWRKVRSRHNGA
jgi:hypothetical protein